MRMLAWKTLVRSHTAFPLTGGHLRQDLCSVILYVHFQVPVSVRAEGAQHLQDWDPRYTGWGTH